MSESRTRATAQQRRQQVVAAALACFRRKGFHQTSMAEISDEAGMSVGHIYRYFKGKEELIGAIVEQTLERRLAILAPLGAGRDLAADWIELDERARTIQQRDEIGLMLEIAAEAVHNPGVADIVENADRIQREHTQNLLRKARPHWLDARIEATAEMMTTLIEGIRVRSIHRPEGLTPAAGALRSSLIGSLLRDD